MASDVVLCVSLMAASILLPPAATGGDFGIFVGIIEEEEDEIPGLPLEVRFFAALRVTFTS